MMAQFSFLEHLPAYHRLLVLKTVRNNSGPLEMGEMLANLREGANHSFILCLC